MEAPDGGERAVAVATPWRGVRQGSALLLLVGLRWPRAVPPWACRAVLPPLAICRVPG
jgi:hypothetical protein